MRAAFIAFAMLCIVVLTAAAVFAADIPTVKYKPELCLQKGKQAYPGQTLKPDKKCKSGLRWVYLE
jgi:hypothetical protein